MTDVTPETKELFANIHMGAATSDDMVAWAVSMLEAGIVTKNIGILASLGKAHYPSEVGEYFARSLKDLGWSLPERESCLHDYMRASAEKILRGKLTPHEGCERIYQAICSLDFPGGLSHWSC